MRTTLLGCTESIQHRRGPTLRHRVSALLPAAIALALIPAGVQAGTDSTPADSTPDTSPEPGSLADLLPAEIAESGEIVAGALLVVPPLDFFDDDGEPAGINVDLAALVGELLGVEFTFEQYDFAGLQPAMLAGQIDIIWDSMNDTVERQETFDFIDYLAADDALLVADGNPLAVETLADLCGYSVVTVTGAVQAERVEAASEQCEADGDEAITLDLFPNAGDARLQVRNGRADAFIGNSPVLLYLADTAEDGTAFDSVSLAALSDAYYGIAVNHDDSELRDAIVAALQAVIDSGEYTAVLDRYGLADLGLDEPLLNAAET